MHNVYIYIYMCVCVCVCANTKKYFALSAGAVEYTDCTSTDG